VTWPILSFYTQNFRWARSASLASMLYATLNLTFYVV
jgi:hypothetical protein